MKGKYSKAIKQIARQHGVSEEIVYNEMKEAIKAGYNNPDPAVQAYWKQIGCDGEPTPEKLIEILAGRIGRMKK